MGVEWRERQDDLVQHESRDQQELADLIDDMEEVYKESLEQIHEAEAAESESDGELDVEKGFDDLSDSSDGAVDLAHLAPAHLELVNTIDDIAKNKDITEIVGEDWLVTSAKFVEALRDPDGKPGDEFLETANRWLSRMAMSNDVNMMGMNYMWFSSFVGPSAEVIDAQEAIIDAKRSIESERSV